MNSTDLEIDHLFTQNRIFGVDLPKLLDDSYFRTPNTSILVTADKTFENLTIGQLIIESDFWQIGKTTEEILQLLDDLAKPVKIKGPITFTSTFNITNLTVTGYINDIPSWKFGQQWLLDEGKQVKLYKNIKYIYIYINGDLFLNPIHFFFITVYADIYRATKFH